MILIHLFSIDELKALDDKQLHILRHSVEKEIITHPDLLRILGERAHERYNEIRAQGGPARARGSRPRRTPDPGT